MSLPEIRHVVFDIGNVLIHYDPHAAYRTLIPDADARARFLADVCTNDWNREQDRGRPWPEGEALLIEKFPEQAALIRAFRANWHQMITHHYEDSVALLDAVIDARRDVTMLTNFASDTYREVLPRFGFLARPRGVTVSGDIGLLKPEAEIYARHTDDFGLDAAATLFIDDSAANVQGARDFGWQAVRFTGAEDLRGELERYGVL